MKISLEEAKRRLCSSGNLANLASTGNAPVEVRELQSNQNNVTHIEKLRPKRTAPNIPEFKRDIMADLVATGQSGQQIADAFGVSRMSVSNAARGMSGGRPPTEDRRKKIEARQNDVKDAALDKLMLALGLITAENLAEEGPKNLSLIAKNMSSVMHQIEVAESEKAPVNIIVYTPEMKRTEQFKVIDV